MAGDRIRQGFTLTRRQQFNLGDDASQAVRHTEPFFKIQL